MILDMLPMKLQTKLKKETNEKKSEQTVTKKSLLKELFLSDKDNDKRKPLNLDCLELKPEFAIKYKRPE